MKQVLVLILLSAVASAADFAITIGPPAAAIVPGDKSKAIVKKTDVVFSLRLENCTEPATAQVLVTVEGIPNGSRHTMPGQIYAATTAGVYTVARNWPSEGTWLVNVNATCAGAKASALVPVGPAGFMRESSKFYPRRATEAEIEATLKAIEGGKK